MKRKERFALYLSNREYSENTVTFYVRSAECFFSRYTTLTTSNLLAYKKWLIDNRSVQTANLRINGINSYLDFIGRKDMKLRTVRIHGKPYVENVISDEDYRKFKACLGSDGRPSLRFAVWTMAATGARVSELLKMTIADVDAGHMDFRGKGGKFRRIYLPSNLQREIRSWLTCLGREEGHVFLNRYGKPITPHGLAFQLRQCAMRYGIDAGVVHPHSFRHRFALNFLSRHNDISLLADLMGHSSLETTRIYLRKSPSEQSRMIDEIVDW